MLRAAYPNVEIAVVAGNHEFWRGRSYGEELEAGRERARSLGVHLLENDTAFLRTLRSAARARRQLLDGLSSVRAGAPAGGDAGGGRRDARPQADPLESRPRKRFPPQEALAPDEIAKRSLLSTSDAPFATRADLVISGHTHRSIDFRRGRTRFVSNPRGARAALF